MPSKVTPVEKSGALGTSTKSCSNIDFKKKKILLIMINVNLIDHTSMLCGIVQAIFCMSQKKLLKEQHRICACGKHKRDAEQSVSVSVNTSNGVASFNNIIHCGSVWVCPSCSFKISQERKRISGSYEKLS